MASSDVASVEPLRIVEPVQEEDDQQNVSSLPPADRGKDAWLFLASSFVIECLIWGFALSFGVMQEYYSTHAPFAGSDNIATVGTTATGLMYFSGPVWFGVIALWPAARRWMIYAGPPLMAVALVASSFATTVDQLIATQGVLYAIGGGAIYVPTMAFVDEWFVQRKGLAFGLMWAGTGMGGVIMPLVLNAGLQRYGYAKVLRAAGGITLALMLPCIPYIKPRLPPSRVRRFDLSFLKSPVFLAFEFANGMGYFIPGIYLPSFARDLGAGETASTLTLVAFNMAGVGGSILVGSMTDRLHATTVTAIVAFASATSVLAIWGLSSNLALLFVFCIAYGFSAGGFTSCFTGILRLVQRSVGTTDLGLVLGFLTAGRGIGNVISGPVSEKLMGASSELVGNGYSSGYGPLVVFTGVTAACSGYTVLVGGHFEQPHRFRTDKSASS